MSDFDAIYENKLLPQLEELEARRKAILRHRLLILGVIFVLLLFFSLFILAGLLSFWTLLIPVVLLPLIGLVIYRRFFDKSDELAADYRAIVAQESINAQITVVDYQSEGVVPYETFQASNLFPVRLDHYTGRNFLIGKIDKVLVQFSEVEAGFDAPPLTPRSETQWMPVFDGIFMNAEFKQSFATNVLMQPDDTERNLGILGRTIQSFNFERGTAVRTGNTAFSRDFVVYSERPLEALRILSPDIIDKIVYLKQEYDADVYFSCYGHNAYIAVQTPQSVIPFSLARSLHNPKRITRFYEQLSFMTDIVRALDKKLNPIQFGM